MKCIIVDDERLAQQVISNHLQRSGRLELAGVCSNVQEARAMLGQQDIDIMFLDIQLPGTTGLEFLRSLSEPPLVVLTTAYAGYALESYEYNVVDYLLKPISFERFTKAIDKIVEGAAAARQNSEIKSDHIFIKSGSKFLRINFADIVFLEGMKDYVKIHTQNASLLTHQTMQDMEELLPARQFIRVHRSYIVAIAQIRSIHGNSIETAKAELNIGSSYKEQVMKLVGKRQA
ncbi:MAG TPA: LytTR family DNA-binding domain-containing protein [Panacibacter sp.]|mgnify:FL=1|nr:LytTR family DNA-binding domain-containing protein [Panacibacter sp.]HNP46164.1 LytTR family DNA-binding domain-containing protein [Panacibacter sp.]